MKAITRRMRRATNRMLAATALITAIACADGPMTAEVDPSLSHQAGHAGNTPLGLVATAEFYESRPETCYETVADVRVTETAGPDPEATLDFRYYIFGICDGQQGLFYYDLDTLGEIPIDPADITFHPGLKWATLDTEVRIFDGESGTFGTIQIEVTWQRTNGRSDGNAIVAELEYSGAYSDGPGVNPIASEDAELVRLRP